jgi:hypothetical protein
MPSLCEYRFQDSWFQNNVSVWLTCLIAFNTRHPAFKVIVNRGAGIGSREARGGSTDSV